MTRRNIQPKKLRSLLGKETTESWSEIFLNKDGGSLPSKLTSKLRTNRVRTR